MRKAKNNAELEPIVSMKEQLELVQAKLSVAHKASNTALSDYVQLVSAWDERHTVMLKIIERSKMEFYHVSEDAVASLEIFLEKANRYKVTYERLLEKETEYGKQLAENLNNVDSKILQIASIERFSSLDKKLQELTAGTDIVHGDPEAIDSRSIQKIVFTAQALIDMNKERSLV